MADVEIARLADHPEAIPLVAGWWFDTWLSDRGITRETFIEEIRNRADAEGLPIPLVALVKGQIVGSAELKDHELEEHFPELRFWVGSIYVTRDYRGQGIGSLLIEEVVRLARSRGIAKLHLQTEALDGGLYARLGWKPIDTITVQNLERLVMVRHLLPE